jgi:hypothetical protein
VPKGQLTKVQSAFRAAAEVFIPETAAADPDTWRRLEEIVEGAIAGRPPRVRRQILLLVRILDAIALARHGRRLSRLDFARRTTLLERLSSSRVLLLRRGIWGLRTLVQMGWYAQPEIQRQLGYRASIAGWEAVR